MAQLVKYLPHKPEDLSQNPRICVEFRCGAADDKSLRQMCPRRSPASQASQPEPQVQ